MPLWIPITVAAALFQNIRTTMQQKIRGVLSVDGANFVRYLYGAPLAPYPCTGSAIEKWHAEFRGFDFLGMPTVRIVNSYFGDCLDFDGGIPPEQAALRTWPCTNSWTQSWYLYT